MYNLTAQQIKKLNELAGTTLDPEAPATLQLPQDPSTCQTAHVHQGAERVSIELWQAFKL